MTSQASVEKEKEGWFAIVDWAASIECFGPFRWKWQAKIIAWMFHEQH
jgi:hypothetical protein